jgi:hypothetical protein
MSKFHKNSESENMERLKECLTGPARDCVKMILMTNNAVDRQNIDPFVYWTALLDKIVGAVGYNSRYL